MVPIVVTLLSLAVLYSPFQGLSSSGIKHFISVSVIISLTFTRVTRDFQNANTLLEVSGQAGCIKNQSRLSTLFCFHLVTFLM